MAGPSIRETSPTGNAAAGTSGASTFSPAIVVLLVLGLALRLIIAHVLLPGSGFPNDLASFRGWSDSLTASTPLGFYDRPGFLDYPPVYLLFLYGQGVLFSYVGGVGGEAIKVVPILADLALALVVYVMAAELGASRRRALLVAGVVILNPITWFNSAIWGQADAVGSVFLLLGLRALLQDRRELASALAVVAALTKIQLGILGFLVGFVVLRRSLAPRDGKADPARVLTSIAAGLGTAALVCLPFTGVDYPGLPGRVSSISFVVTVAAALATGAGAFVWARRQTIVEGIDRRLVALALAAVTVAVMSGQVFDAIVNRMINTFGEYPYLTLNAYNPWALVEDEGGGAMAKNLAWVRDAPLVDEFGRSFPGFYVGPFSGGTIALAALIGLLLAGLAIVAWKWARSLEDESVYEYTADGGAGGRPTWRAAELRGVAAACLVAAAVIAFVFGGQIRGAMPAAVVGEVLLVAILVGVGIWAAWRDDRLSIVVALAILTIAFFVVPTRAHERYLFPFFAVGALLMALSWRWALAYAALALVNSANLLAVLPQYCGIPSNEPYDCLGNLAPLQGGSQPVASLLIGWGDFLREAKYGDYIWPIALSAAVTGLALLWALWQMRGRAVEGLAGEARQAGAEPETGRSARTEWEAMRADGAQPAAASTSLAAAGAAEERQDGDEYYYEDERAFTDDDPEFVPQPMMRLWRWLSRASLRPDRSPALASEPRGRLDKLDLWVVVALIAVILSMRVYRLDEPAQTHFDEVYHARTATEFLQEWRYGIPHDIYEWTHPHLAKYGIAAGITVFSDHKVTATGQLGVPVEDVAIQPRVPPATPLTESDKLDPRYNPNARLGDRVFVATGSDVRVYDLETRTLEWTYAIPNATAVSLAAESGYLYAGTSDGFLWRIDMGSLDEVRMGKATTPAEPVKLAAETGIQIERVYAGAPPTILAIAASGDIVSVDGEGKIVGRGNIPGAADFVRLGNSPPTVAMIPDEITDPAAEASVLAGAVSMDESAIEAMLSSPRTGQTPVPLQLVTLDEAMVASIQARIVEGLLPGIQVTSDSPQLLVAYSGGIGFMDTRSVAITSNIYSAGPATSLAVNTNSDQASYAAAGDSIVLLRLDQANGSARVDGTQTLSKMPGPVTRLVFDDSTKILQALGRTPDGKGWTLYAIEINANAVFSDAVLPWEPVAIALDSSPQLPSFNRHEILAFAPDGSMAAVDVGQFAFSWRIVGVLFGALMAVCIYLLARLLFRRRSVALLAAFFTAIDGMFFVSSRIAMNDAYVGGLLLLAYVIFAVMWLNGDRGGRLAWLGFWLGMPLLGLTLGLALAAKWVAMYAIASIGILILARSALGRVIAILALAAGTGILGWMAIAGMHYAKGGGDMSATLVWLGLALVVALGGAFLIANRARTTPDRWFFGMLIGLVTAALVLRSLLSYPAADMNGSPNYTFFMIMLAATMVAAAANAYHPIAWTRQEMWFSILAPMVVGALALAIGLARHQDMLLKIGAGAMAAGPAIGVVIWIAGRWGFGPLAAPPPPDDPTAYVEPPAPAPAGWLRLGSGFGLPAVWLAACLVVLPIAVYMASYIPWAMPWQPETAETGALPILYCFETSDTGQCLNAFPSGHTGQTLMDLTVSMYNYHNDLRATHAASSPWWAWPLDLKPVWFESDHYALSQGSMIYDGGNPVLWWLAIAAMAFVVWQAFKRRSLGLTLIAVAFAWQWLSWARIDRAAFQYHFYTALPFFLMGLAYFLSELWHGPSRRTWLLARIAGAALLLFPALLWLAKGPFCGLARVDTTSYWGQTACLATEGNFVVEQRMFLIAVVLLIALAVLGIVLTRLERTAGEEGSQDRTWAAQLLAPVGVAGILLILIGQYGSHATLFEIPVRAGGGLITVLVPLLALTILAVLAAIVLLARDPRRFVAGFCASAGFAFLVLYPNLSALLMPDSLVSVYNGFLPTWLYGFQFAVNMQPAVSVSPTSPSGLLLAAFVGAMALVTAYAAWTRRIVNGYRRHLRVEEGLEAGPDGDGPEAG